jgi:hypothetical protein
VGGEEERWWGGWACGAGERYVALAEEDAGGRGVRICGCSEWKEWTLTGNEIRVAFMQKNKVARRGYYMCPLLRV